MKFKLFIIFFIIVGFTLVLFVDSEKNLKNKLEKHIVTVSDELLTSSLLSNELLENNSMLDISRISIKRINYLRIAFKLTKDDRYAAKIVDLMLSAAELESWNETNYLDTAEMMMALSMGLDALEGYINQESSFIIKHAILEKGLKFNDKQSFQFHRGNNWDQVVHASLIISALAVRDVDSTYYDNIPTYLNHLEDSSSFYDDYGRYAEGPCYWRFGTIYHLLAVKALQDDFPDSAPKLHENILKSAHYYQEMTSNNGTVFNYSDCNITKDVASVLYGLAQETEDDSLLWLEQEKLDEVLSTKLNALDRENRFLPFILDWWGYSDDEPKVQKAGSIQTSVATYRDSWDHENYTYIGLKGGNPSESHGQMDSGSFIFEKDGLRWFVDIGMQNYASLLTKSIELWDSTQTGERWDIAVNNNFSHNNFSLDNTLHDATAHSPLTAIYSKQKAVLNVDISKAFGCEKATRTLTIESNLLISDYVECSARKPLVWRFVTPSKSVSVTERGFELRFARRRLTLTILNHEKYDFELKAIPIINILNEHDVVRNGFTVLEITMDLHGKDTSIDFVVE
jgi:hypothetical protein